MSVQYLLAGVKQQAIYEYLNTVYSRNIYPPKTQAEMREHPGQIIKKIKKKPTSLTTRVGDVDVLVDWGVMKITDIKQMKRSWDLGNVAKWAVGKCGKSGGRR